MQGIFLRRYLLLFRQPISLCGDASPARKQTRTKRIVGSICYGFLEGGRRGVSWEAKRCFDQNNRSATIDGAM